MIRLNCNAARRTPALLLLVALLGAGPATAPVDPGNAAMAEHFAQLAQMAVSTRAITPETLRQSVALLKAATKLKPTEVRFARLLAGAALQAGDTDTAYAAYCAIKDLVPTDRGAQ